MADLVPEGASAEQETCDDDRVRVDDPQLLSDGGVEILDEAREGGVENRVIERDEENAHANRGEQNPARDGAGGFC